MSLTLIHIFKLTLRYQIHLYPCILYIMICYWLSMWQKCYKNKKLVSANISADQSDQSDHHRWISVNNPNNADLHCWLSSALISIIRWSVLTKTVSADAISGHAISADHQQSKNADQRYSLNNSSALTKNCIFMTLLPLMFYIFFSRNFCLVNYLITD